MLNMRRFAKGVDEPVWVEVLNAARKDREDWRAITAEEMLLQEKGPEFDFEGRFIAGFDGKLAGVAHAHVDKLRKDGKGFIRFDVIPEFRGCGIERQLIETALRELKARGMTSAQAQADSEKRDYIELLEGFGFSQVRVFSMMEMDLANVSQNIGESKKVSMRSFQKDLEEDIALFNWLINETFKEHFDYRPEALEETRHFEFSNPYLKEQEVFFAVLDGESVGFIGVGIDEEYNLEKKVKAGEIFTIGVLKTYRRTGIGVRLTLHGLETLKAKGMTKAMLGVDDQNPTKAIGLYEKVGFRAKQKYSTFERAL